MVHNTKLPPKGKYELREIRSDVFKLSLLRLDLGNESAGFLCQFWGDLG